MPPFIVAGPSMKLSWPYIAGTRPLPVIVA